MLSYQEILKLVQELPEDEQALLANDVLAKQAKAALPNRESLIQELADLREAGAFQNSISLYGKFANPLMSEVNADDLYAELNTIATEWEQELNEFDSQ